jgi:hypothetical protein
MEGLTMTTTTAPQSGYVAQAQTWDEITSVLARAEHPIRLSATFNGQAHPKRSRKTLDTHIRIFRSDKWLGCYPVAECWTAGTIADLRREADDMLAHVRERIIDEIGG